MPDMPLATREIQVMKWSSRRDVVVAGLAYSMHPTRPSVLSVAWGSFLPKPYASDQELDHRLKMTPQALIITDQG